MAGFGEQKAPSIKKLVKEVLMKPVGKTMNFNAAMDV